MPQAIVRPEDLETFARNLKVFNEHLKQDSNILRGQFNAVGTTWRDQEHAKFAHEFNETMKVIHRFIQISDEHIPFLLRKAQRAREYLNQK